MLVKNAENRGQLEFVSLEEMVPRDHLLRKIDAAVDFNTKHTLPATSKISSLMFMSLPAMSMTAQRLTLFTMNCASAIPNTKP